MTTDTALRIARPSEDLERIARFYVDALGMRVLGSFEDHNGFDGVMVGLPGALYHLEFTSRRSDAAGRQPIEDHLLVFYLPRRDHWHASVDQMLASGGHAVPSLNPYWNRRGATFEDPDGYRIVLENSEWSP